jgi:predicted acylesterase/phospholipase RssA
MSTNTNNKPPTIKHLVIAAGGPSGCTMYGALRLLNQEGVWNINDIKTMYGSSVGSFIAVLLSLNYEWKTMDTFLLKRPWSKIYMSPSSSIIGTATSGVSKLYHQCGIYGIKEFTESLRPAMEGKDFNVNVTMKEFYDKTGIELHFVVTELNKFESIDMSYKTHPNQSLIEACYMSCCYPFIFTPIFRDGCVYIDGAIINDYPLNNCIRSQKCDIREILGVKMEWERIPASLNETTTFTNFIYGFFNQISANMFENRLVETIPNEVICFSKIQELRDWVDVVKDENCRRELIVRGETFAKLFLSYRRNHSLLHKNNEIHTNIDATNIVDATNIDATNIDASNIYLDTMINEDQTITQSIADSENEITETDIDISGIFIEGN